jgi:hypothetical protein
MRHLSVAAHHDILLPLDELESKLTAVESAGDAVLALLAAIHRELIDILATGATTARLRALADRLDADQAKWIAAAAANPKPKPPPKPSRFAVAVVELTGAALRPPPPPLEPTLSLVITPPHPQIEPQTPKGATIATLHCTRSDGVQFRGHYAFAAPNFDCGGVFAISGNKLIVNPTGPGVGTAIGRLDQYVTIEAVE